jgi:hypothetical protein
MNKYFKYIISFLLGFIIYFLLRNNLEEGFNDDAFVLLSRIIGENDEGDNRTDYTGCQNYTCDNKTYTYDYLNSISDSELIDLAFKYIDKDYSINNFYEIFNEEFDTNLSEEDYKLKLRFNNRSKSYHTLENVILHREEHLSEAERSAVPFIGESGEGVGVTMYENEDHFLNRIIVGGVELFLNSLNFRYFNKGVSYYGSIHREDNRTQIGFEYDYQLSVEFLFESTGVQINGKDKKQIIRNIIKKSKSRKFVSKDYDSDNIDYLTCNNEPGNLSSSSLGKKCNHEICCFNTNCNSNDVKSTNLSEVNLSAASRRRLTSEFSEEEDPRLNDGQCEENSCNGGICVWYNDDKFYCNCPRLKTGSRCETSFTERQYEDSSCFFRSGLNFCSQKCVPNGIRSHCECHDLLVPMYNGEPTGGGQVPGSYCGLPNSREGQDDEDGMSYTPDLICPEGSKIKKDSNCRSIEGCKNNYTDFCCSNPITDDLQLIFNTLDADGDGFINLNELLTYINLVETSEIVQSQSSGESNNIHHKLNKILTKTEDEYNVRLDIYDLNDLLNE